MKTLQKFIMLALLCLPSLSIADHHGGDKQTRIIIQADGELDSKKLAALMLRVHENVDTDGNVNVEMLVDDEGNVEIDKAHVMILDGEPMQGLHRMSKPHGMHAMIGIPPGKEMTPAVAKCVLKSLGKVNSDAAAMLLHKACRALDRDAK
ncbi:MAG: hypothetical protein NZ730_10520 [Porticoccaceae bacterium]|nr:hypothetical protein [Porticoccaceae bacterium]